MEQQRQLNDHLVGRRRHRSRQMAPDDDMGAGTFSGVVVVKETAGTCRDGDHVTRPCQLDCTDTSSDSGASSMVMSTSSDNGQH